MKKQEEILSLGSIVTLKGSAKKVLIVGRALLVNLPRGKVYFDYAACTYPEGIMGEQIAYFQQKDIQEICFHGFTDEEDSEVKQRIVSYKEEEYRNAGDGSEGI